TFRHQVIILSGIDGASIDDCVSDVKIADVNHDRKTDLIYTGGLFEKTVVRLGTGDGVTFGEPITAGGGGPAIAVTDLNHDGNLDLLDAIVFDNKISFALGDGDGTFSAAKTF